MFSGCLTITLTPPPLVPYATSIHVWSDPVEAIGTQYTLYMGVCVGGSSQHVGGMNTLRAVMASLNGSSNSCVTSRSLSFILTGNFSMSNEEKKNKLFDYADNTKSPNSPM